VSASSEAPARSSADERCGPLQRFRAFPRFSAAELAPLARIKGRIDGRARDHFDGDGLGEQLVRALAARRALPVKEVFESFEVFARARRKLRAPRMADLCCGHGLVGALFAAYEREVEEVVLLDRSRPASHALLLAALEEVAPWAPAKLTYVEAPLSEAAAAVPADASLVAVHACGARTDRVLELAMQRVVRVAALPCCPQAALSRVPPALVRALGPALACDTARTLRLEQAGLVVRWDEVPSVITPMNRLLLAWPRTPPTPRAS